MGETSADGPVFSVLVAAYNAALTLEGTLASMQAQTFSAWEGLIVDDGSRDDTLRIAQEWAARDSRIRVLHQENRGTAAARNAAARMATGEYLCLLDADDSYRPDYLAVQRDFILDHPGYDIYSCNATAVLPDGETRPYATDRYPRSVQSLGLEDLIVQNRIFVAATVRAEALRAVGGFREGSYVEDYDLWLRMLAHGARHLHNPASLVLYRVASDGKTADAERAVRGVAEAYQHLLREEPLTPAQRRSVGRRLGEAAREMSLMRAHSDRRILEERLAAGDHTDSRTLYWSTRRISTHPLKYVGGLALVLLNPSWLAAVLGRGRGPSQGSGAL